MKNTKFNPMERIITFSAPVFVPLLLSQHKDGDKSFTRYHSDVELVLNQTRLDNVSLQAIISTWRNSSGQDTSRFTDEQLISTIKSRHLQTASEVQSWLNYLDASALNVIDTVKNASSADVTEPVKNTSSAPEVTPSE